LNNSRFSLLAISNCDLFAANTLRVLWNYCSSSLSPEFFLMFGVKDYELTLYRLIEL